MTVEVISDLMHVLSRELRMLAEATDGLHDVVCPTGETRRAGDVKLIQSIDHTQQTLMNLAEFVEILGDDMSENLTVALENALAGVSLADLKRRLARDPELACENDNAKPDAGDLELFG